MKRVTKKSLDELALVMPVICEMNQRYYVGGNSGGYGDSGDSGGWGGNSGGYGDSGGWGGSSGGNGDYGSGSGSDYGSGNTGGYNGQSEGWKGDEGQYGSSIYDGVNNGGNYNSDSGEHSDPSRAYTYDEYVVMVESGTWHGGCVQGMGYVGSADNGGASNDVVIIGDKRMSYSFDYTMDDYKLVENVGMRSMFGVKGGVVVENGSITVLASGTCKIDGAIFSGCIELLVNGDVVESQYLSRSSGGSFLQGGYQDIGSASFSKVKYGNANIQVRLVVSYSNNNYDGTGYWASDELKEIVYTSKNE